MIGFFYPTAATLSTGALASSYPGLVNPILTLRVYSGDLGLDQGTPRSVYALNTDSLTPIAGGTASTPAIQLTVGQKVDLPNGLGSVQLSGVKRFVSLDIHHDPSAIWVLTFALLAIAGLATSLFVSRRRVWSRRQTQSRGALSSTRGWREAMTPDSRWRWPRLRRNTPRYSGLG